MKKKNHLKLLKVNIWKKAYNLASFFRTSFKCGLLFLRSKGETYAYCFLRRQQSSLYRGFLCFLWSLSRHPNFCINKNFALKFYFGSKYWGSIKDKIQRYVSKYYKNLENYSIVTLHKS